MLPNHSSITIKWARGLSEILANQSGQICPSGATSPHNTQPSVMPHPWLSSCLFSHHLFHSRWLIMFSNLIPLDVCSLTLSMPVGYNPFCRFSIMIAGELAPNVWQSLKSKQAGRTCTEKKQLWILILIFWLFIFINNIYQEKEYLFGFGYLQRGLWGWHNCCTVTTLS